MNRLLICTLALAAMAWAAPTPVPASTFTPQHIPLSRRAPSHKNLYGDDLVAWSNANTAHLRNKYSSKLKSSNRKSKKRDVGRRDTVGTTSLVNYEHDSTFYAPLEIGTPAQTINLILDTGSSDTWVVQDRNGWSPSSSSSFTNSTTSFQITYGSGNVAGTLATDTITLADHTSSSQTFAIATSVSSGLLDGKVDGIMGFGFQSLATSQATPFWQASGADQFGFYLQPETTTSSSSSSDEVYGGQFTLGGTNTSLYQGDINWSDVIDESYWLITLGGLTVGGSTISLDGTDKVAVDTGTTLIGTPASVAEAIYAQIPDSSSLSGDNGYYQFPCTTSVNATLHFGDQEYTLSSSDIVAGAVDSTGVNCMGAFFSIGSDEDDELQYILGDTFLTTVYSVYSNTGTTAQVGFASLADGLGVSTSSTTVSQVTAASSSAGRRASMWTVTASLLVALFVTLLL